MIPESEDVTPVIASVPHKLGAIGWSPAMMHLGGRKRHEDQKFKVILEYVWGLRAAWGLSLSPAAGHHSQKLGRWTETCRPLH